MKPARWTIIGFWLAVNTSGAGAPTEESRVTSAVDGPARSFFADNRNGVGVSIGVWQRGGAYTFNYGTLRPGGTRAPTAATLYPIASITKTFTGTLLAQAELEGRLGLADDIRKYLDGSYPNLEFDGHPIRLFDLVNHRSGLPFFMPERPETLPDFPSDVPWAIRNAKLLAQYSRTDFFADLHAVRLQAIPGDAFRYSNTAAMLAGYILERVYGESYENLLRRKILRPLGMFNTTITLTTKQYELRARGYRGAGQPMPDNPNAIQAAGAIKSNVEDMLRYVGWQIRERDAAVQLSHRQYVTARNYAVGLNWQMLIEPGKRLIWQTGNIDGFHAYCILEPELELGLVVLFNQEDRDTNSAHGIMVNEILRRLEPAAIPVP
jgi:D-alanyl-D-alanine-carboxypeptidase/D-alanyl-D-alanine-endopeptidase